MEVNFDFPLGVEIKCDISTLTDADYDYINELYLDHLIVTFKNQKFSTLPFAKLISKMGIFANHEQMLWKRTGDPSITCCWKYYKDSNNH